MQLGQKMVVLFMKTENLPGPGFRMRHVVLIWMLYMAVSIPLSYRTGEDLYGNMVWNDLLAILALVFAALLYHGAARWGKAVNAVFALLWLLFFPNAPYMITDIIHISGYDFYLGREEYGQLILSTDMTLWIRIVYIGIGILIGMFAGLLSLRLVHILLRERFGGFACRAALLGVFLLSGYGIYLGRFLRLNSWNLLHFRSFLARVEDSASPFACKFTVLYAFFVCAAYVVFCAFCPLRGAAEQGGKE